MKTNKINEIKLPTIEDFDKIQSFAEAVIDCNSVMSGLQNHFELLKRIGDVDLLFTFSDILSKSYDHIVESFKSNLSHEEKD